MFADEWKKFIFDWSQRMAEQAFEDEPEFLRSCHSVYGYGCPGATDEQINVAESRLATKLPFSYREFLKATNGLMQPVYRMSTTGGDLLSAESIDWLPKRDNSWIEAWQDNGAVRDEDYFVYGNAQDSVNFRAEYLSSLLAISDDGDAGIYLLNPEVRGRDGEWEAWHLTSWMPGAQRFQSFEEMMRSSYMSLVKNRDADLALGF